MLLYTDKLLIDGSGRLGVALTPGQVDAFAVYLSELLKWNKKVNLTAITEPGEVVIKHFLDSLALCRMLPDGPFRAADIGPGAGFPGLAVKVARPDMTLALIEPARKKASFLRHIVRTLGIERVSVIESKVESLGVDAGSFDVVFSRAFKEPAGLLPLAWPLLSVEGRVVLSLGPETPLAPLSGWEAVSREEITLPSSDYRRVLVVFKKVL